MYVCESFALLCCGFLGAAPTPCVQVLILDLPHSYTVTNPGIGLQNRIFSIHDSAFMKVCFCSDILKFAIFQDYHTTKEHICKSIMLYEVTKNACPLVYLYSVNLGVCGSKMFLRSHKPTKINLMKCFDH